MFGNKPEEGVVYEISAWYKAWHHLVVSSPIDNVENEMTQKTFSDNVSSVLITKVLMGVYGCIPAYDRYVMDGLKTQNINATFGRSAVSDLLKATVEDENVYANIMSIRKKIIDQRYTTNTDFPFTDYTFMKMVDMLFWEIGAGHPVSVTIKNKKAEFGKNDIKIISNIEDRIFMKEFSKSYSYEICGIEFESKDIGSLIMCIYEEFKDKIRNNEQIRKKEVKEYIEKTLEKEWLATTRYSRKLMK